MNANISYKLVDIDQIRCTYDDSVIKLNNILTNQIKEKIKEDAQEMLHKLNELMFMAKTWSECQYKWLFLEKIYATADNPEPLRNAEDKQNQISYFQVVKEFRNFQFRAVDNPIAMNILFRTDNKANLIKWHQTMVSFNIGYLCEIFVLFLLKMLW